MYQATTHGIRVSVEPRYLKDQSQPEAGHYVWAYTIVIENLSETTVQLKSRFWQITDASGYVQEVRGDGVVGEQPVLEPGERYEYTSGAPLTTPNGFMVGSYQMQGAGGAMMDVTIPAFSLDQPGIKPLLH